MNQINIASLLEAKLPPPLSCSLAQTFVDLRRDTSLGVPHSSHGGRFVEHFVQALQFMETGQCAAQPNVDEYLRGLESRACPLDDGLRICGSRAARAMYAIRSKRNVAHVGSVDASACDRRYSMSTAQWLMAELIRNVAGTRIQDAERVIEEVSAPLVPTVDEFDGRRLVLAKLSTRDELLVLLRAGHPASASVSQLDRDLDRRSRRAVRAAIAGLWRDRMVDGERVLGFRLTTLGLSASDAILRRLALAKIAA